MERTSPNTMMTKSIAMSSQAEARDFIALIDHEVAIDKTYQAPPNPRAIAKYNFQKELVYLGQFLATAVLYLELLDALRLRSQDRGARSGRPDQECQFQFPHARPQEWQVLTNIEVSPFCPDCYRNAYNVQETYCSEKELKAKRWYHVAIRVNKENAGDFHSVALFVNGYDDLRATITYYTPFNNAQIQIGQYRTINGFRGIIQNMVLFLYPVIDEEIVVMRKEANQQGTGMPTSNITKVQSKSLYIENTETYLKNTKLPQNDFIRLGVNESFFKDKSGIATPADDEDLYSQMHANIAIQLAHLLNDESNELLKEKVISTIQPGRYEYLMRACALMVNGELSFTGTIDLSRFMVALKFLDSQLTPSEVWFLAFKSQCGSLETQNGEKVKHIAYQPFIRNLRKSLIEVNEMFAQRSQFLTENENKDVFNDLESNCSEEIDEEEVAAQKAEEERQRQEAIQIKCTQFEDIMINSFDNVSGGYEEPSVIEEAEQQHEENEELDDGENEDEEEELRLVGPLDLPDNWSEGKIQINVNRCNRCFTHFDYSRHSEDEFVNQFNQLGDAIVAIFPNANIIGNQENVRLLDEFEVYIKGIGFKSQRDSKNRFFLFKKSKEARFPESQEVLDQIVCLALMYGDSNKMAVDQHCSLMKSKTQAPYDGQHDYPCEKPNNIIPQPKIERVQKQLEGEMRCCNWGCDSVYQPDRNDKKLCLHHPGRFEFGSEQGLWPEGWTCCRKEWDEPGCTLGNHSGYPKAAQIKSCINHGEKNPKSKYPDSFCGKPFVYDETVKKGEDGNDEPCFYHTGYFKLKSKKGSDGIWTCCNSEERDGQPCTEGKHTSAQWPEEEAKKYFFDKPLKNPADQGNGAYGKTDFELFGRFSGYFRDPQPYIAKNPVRPPTLTPDEEKRQNAKPRYCLNWACTKVYKQQENHKRSCKSHPGKWDFGYSGQSVSAATSGLDPDEVLWKPHWTCCRGGWEDEGCTRTWHRGPFLDDYKKGPRQYEWPDSRVQIFFKKSVSPLWQKKLDEQYVYDNDTIFKKLRKVATDDGIGGKIRLDALPEVCDKLGLHLLMNSEEMSYHFKFMDVVNGTANNYLDDGDGCIDFQKFIKWWRMDTLSLLAKDEKPAEQPPSSPTKV